MLQLLVPSPSATTARTQPGAASLLWVSHMRAGVPALRPFSTAFPGHPASNGSIRGSRDTNQRPREMPVPQRAPRPLHHSVSP